MVLFGQPPEWEIAAGVALLVTGGVFSVIPPTLLGKMKPKDAGIIQLVCGTITLLAGLYNFFIQKVYGPPVMLPIIFGTTQVSAGWHNYKEVDATGLGWLSIVYAITCAVVAWIFASMREWIYFGLDISWLLISVSFIPLVSPELSQKPSIFKFLVYYNWIETYIGLLAPGLIILSGHSLLMH